ncbi:MULTISPECIES: hypothetical protein [Ramlibacter]|uniref:Uncharacterized protein n=1 Tax=Ramlibacter pinisoli TaxID=2682844 RepID=A0A6N8J0V5_9BURK|nr:MULTISPECIES: hypothetical protein [Ramlibacter]MBA2961940.1 hypothetical protein [Ramlibacter sp. CGMCC 1.13660]MVQ31883.1 hypothetical protein [Ramlibacter pinisoli]
MGWRKVRQATRLAKVTLGLCALGVLLHAYTAVFKSNGGTPSAGGTLFLLGLLLWSCLPYALWAAVAVVRHQPGLAVGGAVATLAFDFYMHYSVFVAPSGSTAALGLLFAPLWNLLLFGPLGAALSWSLLRLFGQPASQGS